MSNEEQAAKIKIKEMEKKIRDWTSNSSNRPQKIKKWKKVNKAKFVEIAEKLVKSQTRWDDFEGGTGETGNISYGMVKFKKPYLLQPWEEGIMLIFTNTLFSGILGGKAGVLGFGINPFTKELIGVSLYDSSPSLIKHLQEEEEGKATFYFGSTEYTLPHNIAGGFNCFAIPTGKDYRKYFAIAQKIWRNYLTSI